MTDDRVERRSFQSFSELPERAQIAQLRERMGGLERDHRETVERIDTLEGRMMGAVAACQADISSIRSVIGEPPNPLTGSPGSGMAAGFTTFAAESSAYRQRREQQEAVDRAIAAKRLEQDALTDARRARVAKAVLGTITGIVGLVGIAKAVGFI